MPKEMDLLEYIRYNLPIFFGNGRVRLILWNYIVFTGTGRFENWIN